MPKRMSAKRTLSPNYKRSSLGANLIVNSQVAGQPCTSRYQILQNRKRQKLRHTLVQELGGDAVVDQVVDEMLPRLPPRAPITDSNVRDAVGQVRRLRNENKGMDFKSVVGGVSSLLSPDIASKRDRALPVRPRARSCGDKYVPVPDEWAAILRARQQAQEEAARRNQARELTKRQQIRQELLDQMQVREKLRREEAVMRRLDAAKMVERIGKYHSEVNQHQTELKRRKHDMHDHLSQHAERAHQQKQAVRHARMESECQDLNRANELLNEEARRKVEKKHAAQVEFRKMTAENEEIVKRKEELKKQERANDIRLMHEYNRLQDKQERMREERLENLKIQVEAREGEIQRLAMQRQERRAAEDRQQLKFQRDRDAKLLEKEQVRQRRQVAMRMQMRKNCLEQMTHRHIRDAKDKFRTLADRRFMSRKMEQEETKRQAELKEQRRVKQEYRAAILSQAEADRIRKLGNQTSGGGMSSYERAVNSNYLKNYQYGEADQMLEDSAAFPCDRVPQTRGRSTSLTKAANRMVFGLQ